MGPSGAGHDFKEFGLSGEDNKGDKMPDSPAEPRRASAKPSFRGEERASSAPATPGSSQVPRTRAERKAMEAAARARAAQTHMGNRYLSPRSEAESAYTADGIPPAPSQQHAAGDTAQPGTSQIPSTFSMEPSTETPPATWEAATGTDSTDEDAESEDHRPGARRGNPRHARRAHESSTPRPGPNGLAGAAETAGTTAAGAAAATNARATAGAAQGTTGAAAAAATDAARAPIPARDPDGTIHIRPEDDTDARRHPSYRAGANTSFPGLVGWTALGTLVPGLGVLHRNRRSPTGWVLFGGFVLTLVAIAAYALIKGPTRALTGFIGSAADMTVLSYLLMGLIAIYAINILISYFSLRRGHRLTRSRRLLGGVLVASLILITGLPMGVGAYYSRVTASTYSKIFGSDAGPAMSAEDLWADKKHVNVFLMGRDSSDTREGTRPDTMLVASIDTQTGNTTLISIPRNLAFPIFPKGSPLAKRWPEGFRPTGSSDEDLINAVWDWSTDNKDDFKDVDTHGLELGMWATMQAVTGSTGLDLDYWASVNMQGFKDVVNALGGVTIDVERPIPIGGGHNLSTGGMYPVKGWIDPGKQKLKGSKALWYVRSRHLSDNYDRMCRQQRMLKTVLSQADPQTIAVAYPKLAGAAGDNVATSIPGNEIPAFLQLAIKMQSGKLKSAQINNGVTKTYKPDFDELKDWVEEQTDPETKSQQEAVEGVDSSDKYKSGATDEPSAEPTETDEPETSEDRAKKAGLEDESGMCYPSERPKGTDWTKLGWPGPADK